MKFKISTWEIKNTIQTIILFFYLSIAGISSFFKLPINANPIINFPVVTVTVTQSGASPTELENSVTKLRYLVYRELGTLIQQLLMEPRLRLLNLI